VVIFVPYPQLKAYQKIQTRLVRELEKKFSGKHVVFIAMRRILKKPTRKGRGKSKQKRPRRCANSSFISLLATEFDSWCKVNVLFTSVAAR
jgi:hypothetical protein